MVSEGMGSDEWRWRVKVLAMGGETLRARQLVTDSRRWLAKCTHQSCKKEAAALKVGYYCP